MAAGVPMFQHNIKQANQLMRSAIPLMVKLDIPPTPYNYGIWYEYASNKNPKFNQVVDRALRRFGSLPAFVSQELFNEFLLPEEFQHAHRQGSVLKSLTTNLETDTSSISSELERFNGTLRTAKAALKNTSEPAQVEQVALLLERGAFKANQAIEKFSSALLSAQEELASLRSELLDVKKNTELDAMTLLANEKGFERSLFSLVPYAEDDLTLLLIDIDNLAEINQEYGNKAGTSLIRYVAKLLVELLPENGFIARLKGGRFAMLLSETELSVASQLAESIRNEVSIQKIRYKNTKVLLRQVTVSIGVATLFGDESPSELVERSQHYLLYAKRSGKNRIAHHE
ncbi:MAG: GGDEF domain-containing protein [Gammaproteobacteria bacterium]|jgi:diguanylate cyclase|uniref:GGDEF domain-containing protein n=2 Tax=Marinomonas TaxID=28253 RepID=UPI000C2949BB|nr:GGDEF domain-containing protein [Gammaproteobacteria bacterium]MBU1466117.1 GGDEF domain-containing protein [Gammaproteobacteria bacterium]MBU2022336.1 GGDEF domain-containing protein [Gammaproteobacteria bacterium]MBU2237074.1 GGDEF domain-containing protein [Gammaproteobacteria bacterium]MBU2319880.1 GGDEF domain-containing protein [Gammaproteobacteria bacterium]|tara:strand:+ start:18706 stop:19734 length:1029 start_codon:yes stop_codon:yes gene_type:complete